MEAPKIDPNFMIHKGTNIATRDQPKFGKWPDKPNLYVLNRSRTEYRTVN